MGVNSIDAEDDQFAYRYDTQLLIDKRDKDLDEDEISDYITEHFEGNSLIAAGDEELVKIHFHTNEPWKLLEYCNSIGEIYDIVVKDNGQTIAMGRLIGDGIYYLIADIVVKPEYQGKGIGSRIIDKLLIYVDANTPIGGRSSIQLIAEKGKEEFYMKKGFKLIPHEFCGPGMRKIIRK